MTVVGKNGDKHLFTSLLPPILHSLNAMTALGQARARQFAVCWEKAKKKEVYPPPENVSRGLLESSKKLQQAIYIRRLTSNIPRGEYLDSAVTAVTNPEISLLTV